ncbi:hypothetical protein B0T10DRAFT_561482 [Thelonectria olida]|uniref:HNH nuclease domain-containing protein n=1 Tax=Thelonectria olida TaxID=1576542 RepID=A0A9P8W7J0_9HYPO|nr:hypothetical protein B0T10DRAFT_561482 [Thelonectria olida]
MGRGLANLDPGEPSKQVINAMPGFMYDITDTPAKLEQRLQSITQIYNTIGDVIPHAKYIFTRIHFAALLVMPERHLQKESVGDYYLKPALHWDHFRQFVEIWLGFFLKDRVEFGVTTQGSNPEEIVTCLQRDANLCPLTCSAYPVAAHIIPYIATATYQHMDFIAKSKDWIAKIVGDEDLDRGLKEHPEFPYYCLRGLGFADRAWNMLSLDPEIVEHWRKARCAFKYIGKTLINEKTTELTFEFRWLPVNRLHPKEVASKNMSEIRYMFDPASNADESSTPRAAPPMDIPSGKRFNVQVRTVDAPKMVFAMDLQ